MKKFLITLPTAIIFALFLVTTSPAITMVGGINFDDNAFVDELVSSTGDWTFGGGASSLEDALVGSNPADFAYSFDAGSNVVLEFVDNLAINLAGNDLAVFELGTVETFQLALEIGGFTNDYNAVDTGWDAGGFNLLVALINFDDFGLAFGATVSTVQLFPTPYGEDPADFTVIGALNNTSPVPEPATMLLLGTGLIGLAGLGRKKFFKK